MKLKRKIKKGLIVLGIYLIVTIFMLLATSRIERLEKTDFRNSNSSIAIKLAK